MRHRKISRRARTAVAATVVAAVGVVGPAGPAAADVPLRRFAASSAHDLQPGKTATAHCPDSSSVVAAGAEVVGADDGGVVLTKMAPDPALRSVSAAGQARSGQPYPWSVRAYAVCQFLTVAPQLQTSTVASASGTTAACPGRTVAYGTGFEVVGAVDHTYVDGVVFDERLQRVSVHTGGTGTPSSVTAFAICKEPVGRAGVRDHVESVVDGSWPKTVTVRDVFVQHRITGVGAQVRGGGEFFVTAMVPDPDGNQAVVRAVRASTLPAGVAAGVRQVAPDAPATVAADGFGDGVGNLIGAATVFH